MVKSFFIGVSSYGASAAAFVAFSIFFVRGYGPENYAQFSILLNTVSAVTLFGNYHGTLVAFSTAVDRRAFRAMVRPMLLYAAAAAAASSMIMNEIGGVTGIFLVPMAAAFLFIVASGLPTAALLATSRNWLVNVIRALYQCSLIAVFWILYAVTRDLMASFSAALFVAATLYLVLLASRVDFAADAASARSPPRGVLLIAAMTNMFLMAVMLTDKFVIRFVGVGPTPADVGHFLLYLDIAGRFATIYVIALGPFTFEMLKRRRFGLGMLGPGLLSAIVPIVVGAVVVAAGYFVLPPLYAIALRGQDWLPAVIGLYVMLLGWNTAFLAYCNAAGRVFLLLAHYAGTFALGAAAIAGLYLLGDGRLTVTQLASALVLGQCYVAVSGGIVLAGVAARTRAQRAGLATV